MKSPAHPFGLTFDHDRAGKLLHDAKEIASVAAVALFMSCIAVAITVFLFLTKSSWSLI